MEKNVLIARSNLRMVKGQTAALLILILAAAFLLNTGLMLLTDYRQNFDRCHERLQAEHVTLVADSRDESLQRFLSETLDDDPRTLSYDIKDVLAMVGSFPFNGGEINTEFIIMEKQAALEASIGRVEMIEDDGQYSGVYLPILYKSGLDGVAGKTMAITIGSQVMQYRLCGYVNSAMAGSHNCTMSVLLLTDDLYKDLEESGYAPASTLVSVRIHDKKDSEAFEADLKNTLASRFPDVRILSNSYALVSSSRYISQRICSAVVSAMAFLVMLIALVVIISNISGYIQENMKSLGVLKAIGYQNRQIVASLFLQFLSLSTITTLIGIGLSYCLFPAVNTMMVSQTGIPYTVRFLPLPAAATAALLNGAVALAVWLPSRGIRKIEPITALRQGLPTHNFRRNFIPLSQTRASLSLALALKTTLSQIRQNVIVCVTMLVLSLVVVFAGLMIQNVILDMQPFIHMIVGETADSCINVDASAEQEFLRQVRADERVSKIYLYHSASVCHAGGLVLTATMSDDFKEVNNPDLCIEGRCPIYDNETAIAVKYALEHHLEIGDEIILTADGKEAAYLICGFTQTSNQLGKDCLLTRSGYERMGTLLNASYYLNMREGTDIDAWNQEIQTRFGSCIYASLNIRSILEGSTSVYVLLMTVIVIAVLILSMLIVTLVLYLLVKTTLNRKKRDYGIQKALGFTTGQLILQTAAAFMPAVILSCILGLFVSSLCINPLVALFLRGIGIVKCTFFVPVGLIAVSGVGMVGIAFFLLCLLSLKIRKISPVSLLAGE